MIPIHQLLSRIRWDQDFGKAEFVLGYHDRLLNAIVQVPLHAVLEQRATDHALILVDPEGMVRTVPLHRIREVYRNGALIWQRANLPGEQD